jgi:hypothetical protein
VLDLPDFYFTGDDYRYRSGPEAKQRFLDLLRERFNAYQSINLAANYVADAVHAIWSTVAVTTTVSQKVTTSTTQVQTTTTSTTHQTTTSTTHTQQTIQVESSGVGFAFACIGIGVGAAAAAVGPAVARSGSDVYAYGGYYWRERRSCLLAGP